MYDHATQAELHGTQLRLTGAKNFKYDLEHTSCFLMIESIDLVVRSMAEWPFDHDGSGEPSFRTTIAATCKAVRSNLFAFKSDRFLGRIRAISLHCSTGSKDYVGAHVLEAENGVVDELTLSISCLLTQDAFKEVFHPIWLRQAKSTLDAVFHIDGYQLGVEAAFGEPWDTNNFVFDGGSPPVARYQSLSLRTTLNAMPPPLPSK
jgi:hypothetical protein